MNIDLTNWPPVEGRYKVGNKKSPIAVCTNATVEGIELDMEKVSLIGKCVTENIGLEKIIQNIVSNPYIRFLILCGKVSNGHYVDQAIISLKNNGIDKDRKIIGAKGNTPFLKGISEDLIERFRQQITPIDLMPEKDAQKIMKKVEECLRKNPGVWDGKEVKIEQVEIIEAKACPEWIQDPQGFFTVAINKESGKIIVEHFQNNNPPTTFPGKVVGGKLTRKIIGNSAEEISKTIANLELIGEFEQSTEHAMYLARELQKAEIALKNNLDYEQDADIILEKETPQKNEEKKAEDDEWHD